MKKISLLLVLSPILLFSCGGGETSSSVVSSSDPYSSIHDLKSAISVLSQHWDYEVEFSGDNGEYSRIYTEEYVLDYNGYSPWGYALRNGNVYHLTPVGDEVRVGEPLVAGSTLKEIGIPTIGLVDTSSIEDGATSVTLGKVASLGLIKFMGLSETAYLNLSSASLRYYTEGSALLTGELRFSGSSFVSFLVRNVGKTVDEKAIAALDNPYVIGQELIEAKRLFALNNYTRNVYDDNGTLAGQEVYMPRYFYNRYLDGSNFSSGIASFKETTYTEGSNSVYLDGCYQFYLDASGAAVFNFGGVYMEGNDVIESMFYPSLLSLWDNLEVFDFVNGSYVTTRVDYLDEFLRWAQIDSYFASGDYVAESLSIYVLTIEEGRESIALTLGYSTNGGQDSYEIEYAFASFGRSNISAVDAAIEHIDSSAN